MTKLIVLTGSSRGLGHAIYQQLLEHKNAKLICLSRNVTAQQSSLIESEQNNFNFITMDLSSADDAEFESQLENKIRECVAHEAYNEIVFISNASVIDPIGKVGQLDTAAIKQATHINFLAPMLISQLLIRLAESLSVKLKIINISSGAAKHPISGWPVYCATKSAMVMFFDVMSSMPICEVIHIDPGVLDTQMQSQIRQSSQQDFPAVREFRDMQENGRLAAPSVVAKNIIEKIF